MSTIFAPALASTRRGLLAGSAAALAACATAPDQTPTLAGDLAAYADFGPKWAGGQGDNACGAWIENRLAQAGFDVGRQVVAANDVASIGASLQLGPRSVRLALHDAGRAPGGNSIAAPVVVWTPAASDLEQARSAIVIAHLNSRRWSSALQNEIRGTIARAAAAGAQALVLVTHGPTGELIRLNRPLDAGELAVLLMAPRDWNEIARAPLPTRASIVVGRAPNQQDAFNVVGRIERQGARFVVVSTPRSGWGVCAGERGPGVAVFLALAQWAQRNLSRHSLVFACTSAHEFEGAGADAFLEHGALEPEETELWLHLGAGFAARDWHEAGGRLSPLPSPDPQRFLLASEPLIASVRGCFSGAPGLEAPYPASTEAAGELGQIVTAGYSNVVGLLGAHRFHHTASDDMRCVEPLHAADVVQRLQQLMLMACGT